jgi:hypothetical protein
MTSGPKVLPLALMAAALIAVPSQAADDAKLLKDLGAALMVLGMPCGAVVSARRQAENDHTASCRDGNRYRVFVNPDGRVVAQKL